jgi:hypothetical protein
MLWSLWKIVTVPRWLQNGGCVFLWIFSELEIINLVLNFLVEFLLISTHEVGPIDQTLISFRLYVMWVALLQGQTARLGPTHVHTHGVKIWILTGGLRYVISINTIGVVALSLGPIWVGSTWNGDKIQSPKRRVLKWRHDNGRRQLLFILLLICHR